MSYLISSLESSLKLFKPHIVSTVKNCLKKTKEQVEARLLPSHPASLKMPASQKLPKNKEEIAYTSSVNANSSVIIDWTKHKRSLSSISRSVKSFKQKLASKSAILRAKSAKKKESILRSINESKHQIYIEKLMKAREESQINKLKRIERFKERLKEYKLVTAQKPRYQLIREKFEQSHIYIPKSKPPRQVFDKNYKSSFWKVFKNEDKNRDNEMRNRKMLVFTHSSKKKLYSEMVKELFRPSISPNKSQEVLDRNAKIVKETKPQPRYVISELFKRTSSPNVRPKTCLNKSDPVPDKVSNFHNRYYKKYKKDDKGQEALKIPQVDYLSKRRKLREKLTTLKLPTMNLKDNRSIQRAEARARSLERLVNKKETNSVDLCDEIGRAYIGCIKAKLSLLTSLSFN